MWLSLLPWTLPTLPHSCERAPSRRLQHGRRREKAQRAVSQSLLRPLNPCYGMAGPFATLPAQPAEEGTLLRWYMYLIKFAILHMNWYPRSLEPNEVGDQRSSRSLLVIPAAGSQCAIPGTALHGLTDETCRNVQATGKAAVSPLPFLGILSLRFQATTPLGTRESAAHESERNSKRQILFLSWKARHLR